LIEHTFEVRGMVVTVNANVSDASVETTSVGHPDEIASAAFCAGRVFMPLPPAAEVAHVAEGLNRVAGMSAGRKYLGDLVDLVGDKAELQRLHTVVVPDANLVEIVTEPETDLATLAASCAVLEEDGWRVFALIPLNRVGEAHTKCRSSGVTRLQPYWRGRESVAFGQPEIP
jgi:hypothetical protein